ncbi:nucleoside triphosphate pyrophosphohydrolase [Cohnella boryungensis]|uniref:Nucleoside triphosphate pyrophosphohydrolase n=1 Tax=Cohnella boryungensis TaxID=768479 RepID=A0ABV8SA44_9BACL
MPIYNKLVRELIPQVINATGKDCRTRILDEEEYTSELIIKLKEESGEYFAAQGRKEALEELADMLEVIRALAVVHGATWGSRYAKDEWTGTCAYLGWHYRKET